MLQHNCFSPRRNAYTDQTLYLIPTSVVTSFDTARIDIDHLSDLPWSVIIVDEAHKLKNPSAKITRAFHQFSRKRPPNTPGNHNQRHSQGSQSQSQSQSAPTPRFKYESGLGIRFGLTGTAIQNSYRELWTVLDWVNPESVGTDKEWTLHVTKPLVVGQSASAGVEERAKAKV
jgi:SNF2 family DNA or RNA helicase